MLISRLRQRLAIPTALVRAIGAHAALFLLLILVVGCGGQSSTAKKAEKQQSKDKAEKQQKTTAEPPPLTLIPLAVNTSSEGVDPGWQKVSVDLGILNNSSTPQAIKFPDNDKGVVSIDEGRTYDFKVQYHGDGSLPAGPAEPFGDVPGTADSARGFFKGFSLPPGFALCGIMGARAKTEAEILRAEGRVPQGITPASLSIKGYPQVDLTSEPSRSRCAPKDATSLSKDSVTLRGDAGEATLGILDVTVVRDPKRSGMPEGQALMLSMELQNQNNLDDFTTKDLRVWILDEGGVGRGFYGLRLSTDPVPGVRESGLGPEGGIEPPCKSKREGTIKAGPSQTVELRACFPYRPNHEAVASVIGSEVVSAPALTEEPTDAQQKGGSSAGSEKSAEAKQKKGSSSDSGEWTMMKPAP